MNRIRSSINYVVLLLVVLNMGLGGLVSAPDHAKAASSGPVVLSKSPSAGATNVQTGASLVLTFDENVARGVGTASISIRKLSDNTLFETYSVATDYTHIAIDSVSKNVVTINPTKSFDLNTSYYVYIDPGAFVNESNGAVFAGLTSTAAWNFTTVPSSDTTPPTLQSTTPVNGSTSGIGTQLTMTFSEPVYAASGNITIKNVFQSADIQTIGVVSTYVTGSGSASKTITITLLTSLQGSSTYEVQVPSGAFQDAAGNSFAGIGAGSWRFSTSAPPLGSPTLSPQDNSFSVGVQSKLTLTFPVNVAVNTGMVRINKIADNTTAQQISVQSSSVAVSGQTVTITPTAALAGNTGYYVLIDSGAFKDAATGAVLYEGISDATVWNFETDSGNDTTPPTLSEHTPSGPQASAALNLTMKFSEPVYQGTGNIVVKTASTGTVVSTIPVTSSKVTGGGTAAITVTDSSVTLINNTSYYVEIGSQAFRDASGNNYAGITGSSGWTFSVTQDNVKPMVSSLTPADNAEDVGLSGMVLEAVFSEQIQIANPDGVKVKQVSGQISTLSTTLSIDPLNNRKLLIAVTGSLSAGTEYYVEIAEGTVTDMVGNRFDGILNQYQWTFKTVTSLPGAPVVSKAEIEANTKIVITFNEALDTSSVPAAANFYVTVNGAGRAVSNVAVGGQKVTLTLQTSISAGQVVKISYSAGTNPIRDITGTAAADFANRNVTNTPDTTAPVQVNGIISGNMITLIYSEELAEVSPYANNQFTVYVGGSYRSVSQITGSGNTVFLTFNGNAVTNTDSVTLSYYASSYPIKDIAGNSAASFSNFSIQNGVDTTAPVLQSASMSGNVLTLVYSESLNSLIVPPSSAFTVLVNGDVRSLGSVVVSGPQVKLTIASTVNSTDSVVVSYSGGSPAISDKAGNAAAAFSAFQVTGGSVSSGDSSSSSIAMSGIVAKGSVITVSYSTALNTAYVPSTSQFIVKVNNTVRPVSSLSISGSNVLLNLFTPVAVGDTVKVSYASGGVSIRSQIGLEASSFTDAAAANQTTWSDNATGDYESADGGLGIKSTSVTPVTDTSPLGRTANRYQLSAEKLALAYKTIRTVGGMDPKVVFTVPSNENAGLVSVSLGGLEDVKNATPTASFEVIYKETSYTFPLVAIDYDAIAKQMNAAGAVGQLLISIDTNAASASPQLTAALYSSGAQQLSQPVNFELSVTNNGVKVKVENLKYYVTRTVTIEKELDPKTTAAVWLDPETGKLSYVPTHVTKSGSSSTVTFKSKWNSAYAIVTGSVSYADMTTHWASNDVQLLANKYIIDGRSSTKYDPQAPITRAEFATYIAKALGLQGDKDEAAKFEDVDSSSPDAAYIGAAAKAGIVLGYSDGTFKPSNPITREQMAAMMVRAANAAGVQIVPDQSASTVLGRYKDSGQIGTWARSDAAKAVNAGIINGVTSTSFGGKDYATRAQAAIMIKRLLVYLDFLDE